MKTAVWRIPRDPPSVSILEGNVRDSEMPKVRKKDASLLYPEEEQHRKAHVASLSSQRSSRASRRREELLEFARKSHDLTKEREMLNKSLIQIGKQKQLQEKTAIREKISESRQISNVLRNIKSYTMKQRLTLGALAEHCDYEGERLQQQQNFVALKTRVHAQKATEFKFLTWKEIIAAKKFSLEHEMPRVLSADESRRHFAVSSSPSPHHDGAQRPHSAYSVYHGSNAAHSCDYSRRPRSSSSYSRLLASNAHPHLRSLAPSDESNNIIDYYAIHDAPPINQTTQQEMAEASYFCQMCLPIALKDHQHPTIGDRAVDIIARKLSPRLRECNCGSPRLIQHDIEYRRQLAADAAYLLSLKQQLPSGSFVSSSGGGGSGSVHVIPSLVVAIDDESTATAGSTCGTDDIVLSPPKL
jgi:hypothetical protein